MPEITIIIPVYNSEQYLNECLQSVASQTFTNFEVILVDDGSKDRSGEICDRFAARDGRFIVIHKDNEGVAVARNTGFNYAKGEYVTFIDSDDTVLQNYLGDLIALMRGNTQIVLSDLSGKEHTEIIEKNLSPQVFADHPHILNGSPVNKLFLRSIIDENCLKFPDDISTMEDNIFVWNYLILCNSISVTKTNNYVYNQHEGSLVRSVHRTEEIYKLCHTIMPVYEKLKEKFMPETVFKCDHYLFVSCLKRLLISNCTGLTFLECNNLISKSIEVMQPIVTRIAECPEPTKKDSILLKLMKPHWIWLLTLYSMFYSIKYYKK